MTVITTTAFPLTAAALRVFYRAAWSDTWTAAPRVFCDTFTEAASPDFGGATLSQRFGRIMHYDGDTPVLVTPLDLQNKFIKIEVASVAGGTADKTWVGICRGQVDQDRGVRNVGTGGSSDYVRDGVRVFTVLGIASYLDQQLVLEAYVENPAGAYWKINRAITFNEPHQRGKQNREAVTGNRSLNTVTRNGIAVYLFPKSLDAAERWGSLDIANYLLAFFSPESSGGASRIPFELAAGVGFAFQWYETPILAAEGRSVWDLLSQLFDARRGVSLRVEYDSASNKIKLVPWTYTPNDLATSSYTLPANSDQGELNPDTANDITELTLTADTVSRVNQVVVRGARAVSVCTLSVGDGTLAPYWSTAEETAYKAAGTGEPGYAGLEQDEKEWTRLQAYKQERHSRVFRDWGLPATWDGKVKDGEMGAENPYFPDLQNPLVALNYWMPGLRFEAQLPLRTGSDYSDDAITTGVVNTTKDETAWEWRPLLAAAFTQISLYPPEIYDDLQTSDVDLDGGRWLTLVDFDSNPVLEYAPRLYAVTPRPLQDAPGLSFNVQGAEQFVYSDASEFTALLEFKGWARIDPAYQVATVAVEVDAWCEGRYPINVLGGAIVERQIINAGDRARLIYVCPGTVIDIKDGDLERSDGGYLRDDRAELEALARFAYLWYNTPRRAMRLTIERCLLEPELRIGRLITRVGSDNGGWRTLNTPITKLVYTFPEAEGTNTSPQTTTIATDLTTLQFESFLA